MSLQREANLSECIALPRGQDGLRSLDSSFVVLVVFSLAQLTSLESRKLRLRPASISSFVKCQFLMVYSKLWMTVMAYGIIGAGAAFAIVPIYSDMLILAK